MTSLKEWIDIRVEDGNIDYFEYKNFSNIEKIGKGGYGIVERANWIDGGIKVALKGLLNNSIDDNQKENFLRELKLLRQVNRHPNINRFLGVTKDPAHNNYIIVLQYANQGDLREYLEKNFPSLHWKDKIQMALDITCGLKYLHSRQIIHRDLHAKNILANNGSLMIADFGLSKHLTEIKSESRLFGMYGYIEPLCYINNKYSKNEESDIYSLGVLFWEISSGKPPFSEISILGIIEGIREKPTENTPFEYQQLYENCWKKEPNQRPDIDEVYSVLDQLKSQFHNNEQVKVKTKNFDDLNIINSGLLTTEISHDTNDSNIENLDLQNGKDSKFFPFCSVY
ncbi:kinase-like domain-containing protein [Glomus cerebriforme]|uniref:Kinase-like domain-containing protein n=1 Tax=Glomus cerebriforme TaxID=658196 RepID=A0A397T4V3_9GLOM|nr:kinase-like domain-containing protein [Glomus cerebriforme]